MTANRENRLFGAVDWLTVVIYLVLVLMGWLNIYAAVYDDTQSSIFDLSHRYGMQMIWICISLVMGLVILLTDSKYYHMLAYPAYWTMLLVLIVVTLVGKEVNGARSWIMLGPVAFQPTELMKFATALALARYMSNYSFDINSIPQLLRIGLLLLLPVGIIFLQNDTGSAVVYGSFIFMLYREGLNPWVYVVLGMFVLLFIFSFILAPLTLLILVILGCAAGCVAGGAGWRTVVIYLAGVALGSLLAYLGGNMISPDMVSAYGALLACSLVSLPLVLVYAFRNRLHHMYIYAALFCAAVLFSGSVSYVFNNVMQVHQQKRILDLLGLESDLKEWGYNVNQSKIAIGSGGLLGKGYLEGTQTKYNFVPEQSTDFIFCTVGEEWGFVGSAVVLALFCFLILRLMRMGERQHEAFGRVYCYSVASIFIFHVVINIGMTIGLMPVIGIPLPFFSYGGSSLIAFSLLFFVAVKLDASRRETATYTI